MNSIWNKNFEAFQKRFPQLAQMAGNTPVAPESIWQLEKSKNDMITASEGGVRLHSAYNPEREAAGAVCRDEVFEKSAVVFYGFGLGYHVIEFAKRAAERASSGKSVPKLILLEPEIKYFYAALCVLDWAPVFALENLIIGAGCPSEAVLSLLEDGTKVNVGETGVSDAYFFDIPSFTAHAAPYFDAVRAIVKRNQRKNEINAATLKKFGRRWCRNSIKNIEKLSSLGVIQPLAGRAEQFPFLIIGAGPSLETILPYIKELQKRTIILCVETALHTLLRSSVQPDFILLTDPQFWAYRHIAALRAPQSVLITEVSAYPAVFRFCSSNTLLCSSQFPVGQYFEQKLGLTPGDLGTGGSVASCAWNLALFCGAKEIFTAGLDLGFPKGQTHIRGSSSEQTWHTLANRLWASDKATAAALYSANAVTAKDYNGQNVITDSRMKMFAWWFEARLAAYPEVKTYTLCPQGLATPGITPQPVSVLLSREPLGQAKTDFINYAKSIKSQLNPQQCNELAELTASFPTEEFIQTWPFLKDYL